MTIHAYMGSISVIGPGAGKWEEWKSILQQPELYQPAKTVTPSINVLPSAERRRIGSGVKLALSCGMDVLEREGIAPSSITSVFSSSGGDGDNCHAICEALAGTDRMISPTRFHNSVHNAPSGYWGIASGAMLPSTSLCAYDASFAVGLLESATQCFVDQKPVLYVAYDTPYPEPLNGVRPIADQFAIAMVLHPQATAQSTNRIELALSNEDPSHMHVQTLDEICNNIPAARCLPMLHAIASMENGSKRSVCLEYVNRRSLEVTIIRTE